MQDDFDFVCPTKIYFRENGVGEIGKIIHDDYRFKKVFLIYGGSSLKKRGARFLGFSTRKFRIKK